MVASERWLAMLRGEKTDRVPSIPHILGHCAKVMGKSDLGDFYTKPKFNIQAQILTRELYKNDQPPEILDPGYWAACWGTEVFQPYNPKMGAPTPGKAAVQTAEDLEKIEIPDPKTAPWAKEFLEMIRLAVDKKQMPIVWFLGGWVTGTAGMLVELETFMIWMIEEPKLAKKALQITADYAYLQAELFVNEFGADTWIPGEANPTDSNVLLSPDMFAEYPMPIVKKLNEKILGLGLPLFYVHWCSDHNKTIEAGHFDKIPFGENGIIHFGPEVPMELQVEKFGKKYNLLGNINPPLMMTSTYDEWLALCKDNIEVGKEAEKGYAITVGCELPPLAPPSHVFAMTKAAELYGKY
jgi:uroporphyrinogen decarboxylase